MLKLNKKDLAFIFKEHLIKIYSLNLEDKDISVEIQEDGSIHIQIVDIKSSDNTKENSKYLSSQINNILKKEIHNFTIIEDNFVKLKKLNKI